MRTVFTVICMLVLVAVSSPVPTNTLFTEQEDIRLRPLRAYLVAKNSPLVEYAHVILDSSDYYAVDYRLVVSIAGMESNFGRCEFKRYNSWGFGSRNFSSREEAIGTLAQYLSKHRDKEVNEIARFYCPPNKVRWTTGVNKFVSDFERF